MANKKTSFFNLLIELPWWVSIVVSAVTYIGLTHILPNLETDNPIMDMVFKAFQHAGPFFALLFLLAAPFSFFNARRKRILVDVQKDLDSIKELNWKEFEELVAEAFRRQGFRVFENGLGPDGGVDVTIIKEQEVTLVQCKQWRSKNVGVNVVREMFGVLTDKGARKVMIICCGGFTKDAITFAEGKAIDLVGGNELLEIIKDVQVSSGANTASIQIGDAPNNNITICPKCGNSLVERQAKRGANAGNKFVGCSSFPKCRFTIDTQAIQG